MNRRTSIKNLMSMRRTVVVDEIYPAINCLKIGNTETVLKLISSSTVAKTDRSGNILLHIASDIDNEIVIEKLLEIQADPNAEIISLSAHLI